MDVPVWSSRPNGLFASPWAGDGPSDTNGGGTRHVPVLGRAAIEYLNVHDGGLYIDGTFGAGGYTRDILSRADCHVIGIDRDPTAIAAGAAMVEDADGHLVLFEGRFSELGSMRRPAPVDGVVLDLGVSSMQLDQAERGFSFRFEGPLDMRMEGEGPSAADLLRRPRSAISRTSFIFWVKSGIHAELRGRLSAHARRRRSQQPRRWRTLLARVVRSKPGEFTQRRGHFRRCGYFVNDELGELVTALAAAERVLKPGGRLVVVSFHSLEDRIVKNFFAAVAGPCRLASPA